MAGKSERPSIVNLNKAYEIIDTMREDLLCSLGTEEIGVADAGGRVLAEDAVAMAESPPYDMATMDGYALTAGDPYPLRVVSEVFAGRKPGVINRGEAAYAATGAMMPAGANAVIKVEDAVLENGMLTGTQVEPGTYVLPRGADFRTGDRLLPAGSVVSPPVIGMLEAANVGRVTVYRKPEIAVISTGDEIRNGNVRDSNAPMICSILNSWGCVARHTGTAGDDVKSIQSMIEEAAGSHDIIVTIGGVSAGKKDLTPDAVGRENIRFHGVQIKPGKPFMASKYMGKPLLSLPGKPIGSFTCTQLYLKRLLLGDQAWRSVNAPVGTDVELQANGYDYVIFVELRQGKVCPVGYNGSSFNLFSGSQFAVSKFAAATRPACSDGYFIAGENVSAGQVVTVHLL